MPTQARVYSGCSGSPFEKQAALTPEDEYTLRSIGRVESTLTARTDAPRQPDEGAPGAWLVFDDRYAPAPDRPNPIGLHDVHILAVDGARVHVRGLEALNDTPILRLPWS